MPTNKDPQIHPIVMSGPLADLPPLPDDTLEDGTFYQSDDSDDLFCLSRNGAGVQVWRPSSGIAFDAFIIYLDELAGDDANDGLSPATAIQSLDEAQRRWPAFHKGKVRPIFAPGDYGLSDPQGLWTLSQAVNPNSVFECEAWVGGWTDVAGAVALVNTVDDPGGNTITVTGPLPAGLRGAFVRFDSGDNEGIWQSVRTNDATTITLDHSAPNDIGIGTVVTVLRPNARVHNMTFRGATGDATGVSQVFFQGIEFVGPTQFESCEASADRCAMNTEGAPCFTFERARFDTGVFGAPNDLFYFLALDAQFYTYGLDGGSIGGSFTAKQYCVVNASVISDDTFHIAEEDSFLNLFGCSLQNSPITVADAGSGGQLLGAGVFSVAAASQWNVEGGPTGVNAAVVIHDGARFTVASAFIFNNSCGDALVAYIGGTINASDVHGSGNAGFGLVADARGCIIWEKGSVDVSGAGGVNGELQLGSLEYTYAAVEPLGSPYVLDGNGVYSGQSTISDPQGNILSAGF